MQAVKRPALRRFWLGALAAVALIAILVEVRAQSAPGDEAAVLAADQSLGEAMRGGDRTVARRLLSLQFTYTDENGKVHERKAFLDDLKGMAASSASGVSAKIYGGVAMVTGKRKSASGSDAFFLDIWARQRGAWRSLAMQDVVLATAPAQEASAGPPEAAEQRNDLAKVLNCKNPCESVPYRVRSPAEQDIVNTFQAIEKATFTHDADEYAKHLADEFVHYESDVPPVPKAMRVARLEDEKARNSPAILTAIQSMRLWVYGDGAAMISNNGLPDDSESLLRIAHVWVRRNGQWQMVISVQTAVKNQ
jgi:hypothetical protein